jgi:hypothetical protein
MHGLFHTLETAPRSRVMVGAIVASFAASALVTVMVGKCK